MFYMIFFNPNGAGLFNVALLLGGHNVPAPSRSPQNTVKKQFFFDFLKVYNELGKVNKFRASRYLFNGEIAD